MPNVNSLKSINLELIWPIGSYYWSSNNVNPSEYFGGTWEQIKDRFVLAAGDKYKVGDVGGEEIHTLTISEMPKHYHRFPDGTVHQDAPIWEYAPTTGQGHDKNIKQWTSDTAESGEGMPHNNMPPYKVAYCWHRIG